MPFGFDKSAFGQCKGEGQAEGMEGHEGKLSE